MYKILSFLFIMVSGFTLQAQPKFTALEIMPAYPTAGGKVTFNYNKSYGPLVKEKTPEVVVYQINGSEFKVAEPAITIKNNIYSGTITLNPETAALLFTFNAGEVKDNEKNKGYIVPVYDKNKQPVKGYYLSAYYLQSGMGNYLAGIDNDAAAGQAFLEEGLKQYPDLNRDNAFFNAYLNSINATLKKDANPVIIAQLEKLAAAPELSEEQYGTLTQWYSRFKDKEQAEKYRNLQHEKFPNGKWLMTDAATTINKEKDAAKKDALVVAFKAKYGADKANEFTINSLQSQVAMAYAAEKNYEQLKKYAAQLKPAERAAIYNNLSWNMAEKEEAMQAAEEMSKEAYSFANAERIKATQKKPDNLTAKQWQDQLERNKAMYGDTYAFILYKKGDFKMAYPIAREAAMFNKLKDADYNERYALLAAEVLSPADALKIMEPMVKEGTANEKIKESLKGLYVKVHKSDAGYDAYLTALEAEAKLKRKAEIAATIINEKAPDFKLKDFDGNYVSLADMKGKVVILDFWATWCGPCIASMPGMNKTITKYKDRDDVKFLFVDTWENVDNKLENAKTFMEKKNYPFHVIMDTEDKVVADYKVSGIPTKFIIDKQGNIRFKAIGFSGSDEGVIEELTTMIELAEK